MDSKLLAILAALSLALVAFQPSTTQDNFEAYKATWGKVYTAEEEPLRRAIYQANVASYAEHNSKGLSWVKAEN